MDVPISLGIRTVRSKNLIGLDGFLLRLLPDNLWDWRFVDLMISGLSFATQDWRCGVFSLNFGQLEHSRLQYFNYISVRSGSAVLVLSLLQSLQKNISLLSGLFSKFSHRGSKQFLTFLSSFTLYIGIDVVGVIRDSVLVATVCVSRVFWVTSACSFCFFSWLHWFLFCSGSSHSGYKSIWVGRHFCWWYFGSECSLKDCQELPNHSALVSSHCEW